jgi:hypothetical protein
VTQLVAMALSLAVEVPIVVALAGRWRWAKGRRQVIAWLVTALAVTLLSHPLAWATHAALSQQIAPWLSVAWVEAGVVILEGAAFIWIFGLRWRHGFALAAVANASSFVVGLWIMA